MSFLINYYTNLIHIAEFNICIHVIFPRFMAEENDGCHIFVSSKKLWNGKKS